MICILPKTIMAATLSSLLFITQMDAYCARCMKIEEERAKEQAVHPQALDYYDDQISLHTEDDSVTESDSHLSEDSSTTGTGALSGSTYRSTEINKPSKSSQSVDRSSDSSKTQLNTNEQQVLAPNQNTNTKAVNNQQRDSRQFFEEDAIPNETGSESQEKEEFKEGKHKNTPSISKDYSMIYTIIKTKNFLRALDGNFTLFIPTNKAFQQLPPETLMSLTQPENEEKLAALVSNHVVAKKILQSDFVNSNNLEIKAISGRNLTLSYKDSNLYIDNILILHAEPTGFDGVIYIIDKVLLP